MFLLFNRSQNIVYNKVADEIEDVWDRMVAENQNGVSLVIHTLTS
jgi:hypothetical protein